MKASKLDKDFDAGRSVMHALDLAKARRPRQSQRRVNVDFPIWMIEQLDQEASRLGVTRQSIIKVWLAERLRRAEQASQDVRGRNAPAGRRQPG
jgi:hypothetical protein